MVAVFCCSLTASIIMLYIRAVKPLNDESVYVNDPRASPSAPVGVAYELVTQSAQDSTD